MKIQSKHTEESFLSLNKLKNWEVVFLSFLLET